MRTTTNTIGLLLTVTLLSNATAAAQSKALEVVPEVDYQKYAGTWYEVARLPNRFEEDCAGDVTATYAPRPDGRITVTNRCREKDGNIKDAVGVARRVDGQPPSVLKVRFAPSFLSFLPMVWGDYQIIALDPDYRHAVVGSPDRKYLWILARQAQLEPAVYTTLVDQARRQGFAVDQLIQTSHGK